VRRAQERRRTIEYVPANAITMGRYQTDEEMTLLDQFAAATQPAVILKESNFTNFAQVAEYCYTFAQALAKVREKILTTA
jgi:hypothetical protein